MAVSEGANVVIASRPQEGLEAAQASIGGDVDVYLLDASEEEEVARFFERSGRFDHLVTSVGEEVVGAFSKLDTAVVQELFRSKFWSP